MRRVIALEGNSSELVDAFRSLKSLGKAAPKALAVLHLTDIDRALGHYEDGKLTAVQLEEWAELLEMNEHIDYEPSREETIANLLFRLSTPEINEPISRGLASELRLAIRKVLSE